MKKKLLPLAMLAGLAGAAGTAQAVHVNSDGLGEVLLYPFYTVEGGQDTYITVVNTTDYVKAVKVRFLEALNSQEVLDFNLYLSPYDHWSAVLTTNAAGDGVLLRTGDTSCTAPAIPAAGVQFRNLGYTNFNSANQNADGGPADLNRTRQGHVEIIEMGILDDQATGAFGAEAAATHNSSGVPANCTLLRAAWEENPVGSGNVVGNWSDPTRNLIFDADLAGGLYGYGVVINPTEGTNATYDAVAIDNFAATILHARPGSILPNLGQGIPSADIIEGNTISTLTYASGQGGLDAVSAVLMHDTIANDYVLEPGLDAATDWVITFPTKHEYVNFSDPLDVIPPFLNNWRTPGVACEEVQITFWDREEQQPTDPVVPGDIDFSPSPIPEGVITTGFTLCNEVNVISFFRPDVDLSGVPALDATTRNTLLEIDGETFVSALYPTRAIQSGFQVAYNNGWARLSFAQDNASPANERILEADDGTELVGLPVIGFAVQKYTNSSLSFTDSAGDNATVYYSGLISHKATRQLRGTP